MVLELLIFLKIESAHIIGHDTGGGVALILAIKHPEKVNKLILSNAVAYDSWPIDDMLALGNPKWKSKTSQEIAAFLLEGYKLGLSNPKTLSKTFQEGIIAPYLADEGKISLIRNAASLNTNHTVSIMSRHKEVRSETLLLWGIDDPWQTISDAIRLHREIPNSKLVQLDKASHWLQQDAPDRYLKNLLNFLSN
jgi:pimeloyl-ACP methyl ester carboxylesterase